MKRRQSHRVRARKILLGLFLTISLLGMDRGWAGAALTSAGPRPAAEANVAFLEAPPLELGKPIERELGAGKSHFYCVAVGRGQFFQVSVAQRGVDVEIAVFAPDGGRVVESNHPEGALGEERVSWIAQVAGTYSLEVRSVEASSRPGPYSITLEHFRRATIEDREVLAARLAFAEAESLAEQGTADSRRRALGKYQESLLLWQQLRDPREQATCLLGMAQLRVDLGEPRRALDYCEEALALGRASSDRLGEAAALTMRGVAQTSLAEKQRAIENYDQALLLWRAVGYRGAEGQTLVLLGDVYAATSDHQKAIENYSSALPVLESMGDRNGLGAVLNGMGIAYDLLGYPQKALQHGSRAVEFARAVGKLSRLGTGLSNLSLVYNELGEHQKALELLDESLRLRRESGDRRGEAYTLTSIGRTYDLMGQSEKALDYYIRALPIRRAVGDRRGEAITLRLLGLAQTSVGKNQEALEDFNQALGIYRDTKDWREEAETLNNLGLLYVSIGEKEKSVETLTKALEMRRPAGNVLRDAGNLYDLARAEASRGNLSEARSRLEEALSIIESIRTRVGTPDLRSSYLSTAQEAFALAAELWMRSHESSPGEGFDAAAFGWNERARARSLLDLLAEAHANIREGVDAELLERERSLQQRLSVGIDRRMRVLSGSHTDEQAKAANQELGAVRSELEQVEAQIRATGPRYAALTQPQPLKLAEVQQQLDAHTLLLEYGLGKERSFLWAVTPTSFRGYELPGRSKIDAAARRVYDLLTERNRRVKFETPQQRRERIRRADGEYPEAGSILSRMLLEPVRGELGDKRLLIVADGALQYLPFAALPDPAAAREKEWTPLVANHEVVNLPSASTLALLRGELAGRSRAPKTLAVLADPVFDTRDRRVLVSTRAGKGGDAGDPNASVSVSDSRHDLLRSAMDAGVAGEGSFVIPRLPFTRREARAILRFAPSASRKEALDFDASRATATAPDLAQYRYVHFATHGFLDTVHPELSGLVLALVDRTGREIPGFLPAAEVFNLKVPAEVVVLSGCHTALGKEIRGEGLVGLTRGFFYAGAARVIASVWKVQDEATAELMTRLYAGMLGEKTLRPAAALREAQVSMWRENRWKAPYYWSAFILQGEWK